jgi:hypothetical protein
MTVSETTRHIMMKISILVAYITSFQILHLRLDMLTNKEKQNKRHTAWIDYPKQTYNQSLLVVGSHLVL